MKTESNGWPNLLSLPFAEKLYAEYSADPGAVPEDWRRFFGGLADGGVGKAAGAPAAPERPPALPPESAEAIGLQDRFDQMLRAYRGRGHMIAQLDPLAQPRPAPPELDPKFFGFTEADLDRLFSCETVHRNGPLRLREIIDRLRNTYCRSVGVEYMHIDDVRIRRWLQQRMETTENRLKLGRKEQIRILTRLTDAVIFEEFIRKKFVGAKSFSLEGSESLIPLLDLAIEKAGDQGVTEIVLAMAHRGRLNVLANVLGKNPRQIFREFADADPERFQGRGDVKYHLGHSSDWTTARGRRVHLSLCFNPSHLEYVNPVALGRMRAKQDRAGDLDRVRGLVLLIHGDAAFAGEGVVQEALNLSQLDAYRVGGTLHIVVNNQIGFTTSPAEGRSCAYSTDIARMLQIPIFHVNGEDPEAVAQVVRLAMDFRQTFQRDVVIDMYGYRRLGHNETDEPSFTQPLRYRAIEKRKSVRDGYLEHLLQMRGLTQEEADEIALRRRKHLEDELSEAQRADYRLPTDGLRGVWQGFEGGKEPDPDAAHTAIDQDRAAALLEALTRLPADFHLHPKLRRFLNERREMSAGKRPLDWSTAEALAFASLATAGHRIRFSGQDTARGTFSQRHAVLHDYENGSIYAPLEHLAPDQAPVEIRNSPLAEAAVLGFEYGYSLDFPEGLILWEAQFGDFGNAAQVIVDQFIASAEDKWRRLSGIVLLLPHGFEGQGPEHSSARLERFLALAAEDNFQVVYPTTAAQYFHCLRRQVTRRWRKPLVVMTPKSLLRHPKVVSPLDAFTQGSFQRILADPAAPEPEAVRRILLCSGKIYYDLDKRREELKRTDVALIRLEQLYPLRQGDLEQALSSYPNETPVLWVQEEPENMGAWRYLRCCLGDRLFGRHPLAVVARPASASPATGSARSHKQEQEELIGQALVENG